jgi:bifunctional non-homologous end joining protein LigD
MSTITLAAPPDPFRPAAGLPDIEPIALTSRPAAFDDPEWLFEPKYDGLRAQVYLSRGGCEIRPASDLALERLDDLGARIRSVLRAEDAIVDGEVVALDPRGRPVFRDLLRGRGSIAFAAFDLLWLDGRDLRPLPLQERKRRLGALLPADTAPVFKVLTLEEHGRALFQVSRQLDLEGIVAKRWGDPYAARTVWFKVSNPGYTQAAARAEPLRHRRGTGRAERSIL